MDTRLQHRQNCAELHIALDGYATSVIGGKEMTVRPLDVFVITRDVAYAQPESWDYRYCRFTFRMDLLKQHAGRLLKNPAFHALFTLEPAMRQRGTTCINWKINPKAADFAVKTAVLLSKETDQELCDTLFLTLLFVLCKNVSLQSDRQGANMWLAETAAKIETQYAAALDLATLAGQTHYSKRHFTRMFREFYQLSPIEYLNYVRLRRATDLLSGSCMNVKDIAKTCGFADGALFSKHFRRQFGLSPSDYRRTHQVKTKPQPIVQSAAVVMPEPSAL